MLYKIYRAVSVLIILIFSAILSFTVFLQSSLPDSYRKAPESSFCFSSFFGNLVRCQADKSEAKTVFGSESGSGKAELSILGIIPVKTVSVSSESEKSVIVCGTPFGVKMFTEGVLVVGFSKIRSENGISCPASESGLSENDIIYEINGDPVSTNEDVAACVEESGGEKLSMLIGRDGKEFTLEVLPQMAADSSGYKVGAWVRDSSAGIGTLTFYDPESQVFAGLGHAICDVDTGGIMPVSQGELVFAKINSVKKSVSGTPGELCGSFVEEKSIGNVKINNGSGLYGELFEAPSGASFQIANKQDIHEGEATIISTISGSEPKEYSALIESVSYTNDNSTKNMVIKITDSDLIEQTGGIVQGMSGSPIIQDGKLVGAVTHVFVNDPVKGYAIFAENMYDMSLTVKQWK